MIKVHHTHIFLFFNDMQSASNNVVRSLPSIVDKIDLSVIETKLNHYK